MGMLGQILLPVGFFIALLGVILATKSPYMKEMLEQVEFLQKKRRLLGVAMVIIGLVLMALSIGS